MVLVNLSKYGTIDGIYGIYGTIDGIYFPSM